MILLNHRGIYGRLSHLTMKKLTSRTKHGLRGARVSATGILRVSEIDPNNGRAEEADFGSEAMLSVVAKMGAELVDLHGLTVFVPHGSDWTDQVNKFIKDPEQFEAVHPRMMRTETTYIYFARDAFFREVDDDRRGNPGVSQG